MYDRHLKPIPKPETTGLRYRIETLVGITGVKMAKYRASWGEAIWAPINVFWRPHMLAILLFEVLSILLFVFFTKILHYRDSSSVLASEST